MAKSLSLNDLIDLYKVDINYAYQLYDYLRVESCFVSKLIYHINRFHHYNYKHTVFF